MSTPGEAPQFYEVVIPPGKIAILGRRQPWPPHIAISKQFLDLAAEPYVTRGDGMVRFQLDDTTALYGYAHDEGPDVEHYDLISKTP